MAKGISIGVGADTREFSKAVSKGVIDPLEDAQDALDDVARDGDKAGDKLERSFKDAQKATEKFERELSPLAREMDKQTKRGADAVEDNVRRGFGKAEDAAQSFRDEARQNFAETASSFDGSMDSVADMAQSTLGGLATAIPGLGIGLAGLGAIGGVFYNQWKTAAEQTEERISSMYEDMLESGLDYLSAEYVTEQIHALFNPDGDAGKATLEEVRSAADKLGLDITEVGTAWVTSGEDRDKVNAAALEQIEAISAELKTQRDLAKDNPRDIALGQEIQKLETQRDVYQKIIDKMAELDSNQKSALDNLENARAAVDDYRAGLTEAQKEAQGIADEVAKIPDVSTKTLKLTVDDSAVKNWRPPMVPPVSVGVEYSAKFRRQIP